ncbi:hypothetical protein RSOLAG1IB_11334 [Rhizoctonia solani AG-1 IB]|uniref:Fungal-type protein kinase domain-containing protein n=1 Tax=Thanatephorus cucumeris (strain AG1-IB / isolate 7/3/14) TaxID=1108050 RepID=A0A0B7FAY6_THACB|nr:hypothetical protein RSOLAG1IB_11334 [Rhizoctonia solani AG-1 IB]
MESILRYEIGLAVYGYEPFVEEFLIIPEKASFNRIEACLAGAPLFLHNDARWTIDCALLEGTADTSMHERIALILDTINEVAFVPDGFRPRRQQIKVAINLLCADDHNESGTKPDIIQSRPGSEGAHHWGCVEFFAECKGNKSGVSEEAQFSHALLQLARYARATVVHQIPRRHVFAIAFYRTKAIFVRLDRAGIIHSPPIDLKRDFRKFALAAAGLFALDPHSFGYDTRFSFSPPLTGTPKDLEVKRELRIKLGESLWRVLEIVCHRKCLVGRATLVLRLSRLELPSQRAVLKCIWRSNSRPDEGAQLALFKDNLGICKCRWNECGDSTEVGNKDALSSSLYMKSFKPSLPETQSITLPPDISTGSGGSSVLSFTHQETTHMSRQNRVAPVEVRVCSTILMEEAVPLWQIKRLPHLLRVLRDALVGLAGIADKGMVHRDISDGNILCDHPSLILVSDGDAEEHWDLYSNATFHTPSLREDISINDQPGNESDAESVTGQSSTSQLFDQDSDSLSDITADTQLNSLPLAWESGVISSETYQAYVQQRYDKLRCTGKLYDLEFAIKQNQLESEKRGVELTGTPAFISAALLLDTQKRHTFVHDLESIFWVLVWVLVNHTDPGKVPNEHARGVINTLCKENDEDLGNAKVSFALRPRHIAQTIRSLGNGWEAAERLVTQFAGFLRDNLYGEGEDEGDESGSWSKIKSVIDMFDESISQLPFDQAE